MGTLTTMLPLFLEFEAIGGVINAVQNFIGNMFQMNAQFQQLNATLKDMVGSSRAQQLVDWVQQFGQHVPFTTEAVEQATVALTAFGQNAQTVLPAVAAAAAAMSARGITLDAATRAYVDALNGRFVMMSNQLGISEQDLEKFGLKVDSAADRVRTLGPAFEAAVQAKYPNMLASQMDTFAGMAAEANDIVQLLAMHLGAPLFAQAQEGLGMVMQFVSDHSQDLDHLAEIAGGFLADGFRFFGDVISGVGTVLKMVIVPAFQGLMNLLGPLIGPIDAVAGALGRIASITGLSALKGLSDLSIGFKDMTVTGGPLQGVMAFVATSIQNVAVWLNQLIDGVTKGTGPMADLHGYAQALGDVFSFLGQVVKNVVQWFEPVPDSFKHVGDAVIFVKGHASGFQETLAAIGRFLSPLKPLLDDVWQALLAFGAGVMWVVDRVNTGDSVFGQIWDTITSMVVPAFQQLGTTISEDLMPALEHLGNALQPFMPMFALLGGFLTTVFTTDLAVIGSMLGAVLTEIVNAITGIIQALSGLINFVADWFNLFDDLAHGRWGKVWSDWTSIWIDLWQVIQGIWNASIGDLIGSIANFGTSVEHIFQNLFDHLVGHSIVPDTVNAIAIWFGKLPGMVGGALAGLIPQMFMFGANVLLAFITGLEGEIPLLEREMAVIWGTVAGPLEDLGNKAWGWGADVLNNFAGGLFGGSIGKILGIVNNWISIFDEKLMELANNALTWGQHIIQFLIDGIQSELGNLANVANEAAKTIANLLAHSQPKEGPLRDDNTWGGHLVDNIMQGIRGKLPELAALTKQMAGTMVPGIGGVPLGAFTGGIAGAQAGGVANPNALIAALQQLTSQLGRTQPLGAAPVNAQTGSVFQQQIGSLNFNGVQDLNSLSAELNMLFGLMFENAKRGAINP